MGHRPDSKWLALIFAFTLACALSQPVTVTTDPPQARVWLGQEPVGLSPASFDARATGPIPQYTFEPQYVTVEKPGFRRETRALRYEWSMRNVLISIPFFLGVPGIPLWAKLPTDLHLVLEPEDEALR
ncbi:MAG: hypothetical protein CL910_08940 [Deltaproteobacteria bacterium]|jgi:hypothetical protein|nr:hypothetical protein [Deltaproteobacteria bacterium]